jgi:hypothetical protein
VIELFIKSLIEAVDRLIHKGKSYPVVNGVADVPKEVRDEVITYPHWQDATEEIDKKTLTALDKANKAVEKDVPAPEPQKEPPEQKPDLEKK